MQFASDNLNKMEPRDQRFAILYILYLQNTIKEGMAYFGLAEDGGKDGNVTVISTFSRRFSVFPPKISAIEPEHVFESTKVQVYQYRYTQRLLRLYI